MKELKIVQVNNYLLAIDEAVPVKYDEWCIKLWEGKWFVRQMNMNCGANDPECHKIIGFLPLNNAKPLGGVYLLPKLYNLNQMDKRVYRVNNIKGGKEGNITFHVADFEDEQDAIEFCDNRDHLQIIPDYMKASTKKIGYTEEDMRKAIRDAVYTIPVELLGTPDIKQHEDRVLQSLKTFPIAFEAETWTIHADRAPNGFESGYELDGNTLKGKYIYTHE